MFARSRHRVLLMTLSLLFTALEGDLFAQRDVCANSTLTLKTSLLFHSSKRFRETYRKVSVAYGAEISAPLTACLDGWLGADWLSVRGRRHIGDVDSTKMTITSCSIGIELPYWFSDCTAAYIGGGASVSDISVDNGSCCDDDDLSKVAFGAIVRVGMVHFINSRFYIEPSLDYLYRIVHLERHWNLGGIRPALAVGVRF